MIFGDHLGVVKQTADQRAFAIIDTAARDEAQQFFVLMLREISVDIGRDQIGLVGHSGRLQIDEVRLQIEEVMAAASNSDRSYSSTHHLETLE
jgi:hypothetical protein